MRRCCLHTVVTRLPSVVAGTVPIRSYFEKLKQGEGPSQTAFNGKPSFQETGELNAQLFDSDEKDAAPQTPTDREVASKLSDLALTATKIFVVLSILPIGYAIKCAVDPFDEGFVFRPTQSQSRRAVFPKQA